MKLILTTNLSPSPHWDAKYLTTPHVSKALWLQSPSSVFRYSQGDLSSEEFYGYMRIKLFNESCQLQKWLGTLKRAVVRITVDNDIQSEAIKDYLIEIKSDIEVEIEPYKRENSLE